MLCVQHLLTANGFARDTVDMTMSGTVMWARELPIVAVLVLFQCALGLGIMLVLVGCSFGHHQDKRKAGQEAKCEYEPRSHCWQNVKIWELQVGLRCSTEFDGEKVCGMALIQNRKAAPRAPLSGNVNVDIRLRVYAGHIDFMNKLVLSFPLSCKVWTSLRQVLGLLLQV